LADRAVDHLLHVRGVAEQERQIEYVEIVDHRPDRADADAGKLDGADLRLLDRFLFAAKLHGGVHLHAEPAVRRLFELLAEIFDGDDSRIAGRMDVRGFELRFASARAGLCAVPVAASVPNRAAVPRSMSRRRISFLP